MTEKITIAWTMPEPPVAPVIWHRFGKLPAADDGDVAIEAGLGWAAGTLAALRHGFGMKLSRGTGWEDATGVGNTAVPTAARVYKRGVAARKSGEPPKPSAFRSEAYDILVYPDSAEAPPAELERAPTEFTIVDGRVAELWKMPPASANRLVLTLHEGTKTLATVAQILAAARAAGASAAGPNVPEVWTVIGGGLLADVAAFAAGLVGAALRLVPTTLLAMADACIGGKTGVNFAPFGKNQVGLFHFPTGVDVWPGWLKTLPLRELRAGGAECLKHAFLTGDLALATRLGSALKAQSLAEIGALLPAVIDVKAKVVAADPGEAGQRAVLNFGHTMGHALEAHSQAVAGGEALLHGEAVGIGMLFAFALSRKVAGLDARAAQAMSEVLHDTGCAPSADELKHRLAASDLRSPELFNELKRLIGHDKKNSGGTSTTSQWVLLDKPGKVARDGNRLWTMSVFEAELASTWSEFVRGLR